MKKIFKKLAGLMMGLLAVAGLAGLGAGESNAPVKAEAATIPVSTKLYLTPSANWKADNARFAVYFYGNGETWVSMTKVAGETNLYECTSPSDKTYQNLIFCRMNPSVSANNWNTKWNQTVDLTYNGTNNWYTVKEGTWDKGGGTWGTYGAVASEFTVTYYDGTTVIGTKESSHFEPITPTAKEGYVVEGWYADAGFTKPIAEGDAITAKTNVYLKWEKAVAIYAYNANGWTTMNCYLWGSTFSFVEAWPGTPMTKIGSSKLYYCEIGASKATLVTGGIINNGTAQTADITITGGAVNKLIVVKTTKTSGKYNASAVSSRSEVIAHVGSIALPALEASLPAHGLKTAATNGYAALALTKTGYVVDTNVTEAEKQAALEKYMAKVDTCADFENIDSYVELAEGLDTSVAITDEGGSVTIADKLAYMSYLNSGETTTPELGSNLLSVASNNSVAIILIVGLFGLATVAAYYFLNKKRLAK